MRGQERAIGYHRPQMDYRRYKVQAKEREPLLAFMLEALRAEGCTIINHSPPDEAPFRIVFETLTGERMGVLAYAFFANSKVTTNRPDDEWRFQVKYGPRPDEPQPLWVDEYGLYTTLFLGISHDAGFFVGADPAIHNPTKFFISVEFKEEHVTAIRKKGWHAWERERRQRGAETEPIEVLVGGQRKRFLDYIRFERAAERLDPGNRQLLAEKWMDRPAIATSRLPAGAPIAAPSVHAIAREFEMSETQVLDMIGSARRLKMAVRGWVAEEHLVERLQTVDGVSDCVRLDIEGGADVALRYEGSRLLQIQCKNVLRDRAADGTARMDLQKTRASKNDPCSRYYRQEEYDLIAACLHAVTERWEYKYALPARLTPHKTCPGRLSNTVRIDDRWSADARAALLAAVG